MGTILDMEAAPGRRLETQIQILVTKKYTITQIQILVTAKENAKLIHIQTQIQCNPRYGSHTRTEVGDAYKYW